MIQLGSLVGPLLRLIKHREQYDAQEEAEAIARYCAEYPQLERAFHEFATGQPGYNYAVQNTRFSSALSRVQTRLTNAQGTLDVIVPEAIENAYAAIDAVPVPRTSVILEAGTPFTAYRKLRELCEADATKSLLLIDAYLDSSVFIRYLADIRPSVAVTLLSQEPSASSGVRERQRWDGLLDASQLYSKERGATLYRLVNHFDLHDRWIVVDDSRIYSLGGSPKDAAARDYFTITSVESSPANLAKIQAHLSAAVELFGPNRPTHV